MSGKSVQTPGSKIRFSASWKNFPTSIATTLNSGAGGMRELTLDANKIEQVLQYRKMSFSESVSTTFAAHSRFKSRIHLQFLCDKYI